MPRLGPECSVFVEGGEERERRGGLLLPSGSGGVPCESCFTTSQLVGYSVLRLSPSRRMSASASLGVLPGWTFVKAGWQRGFEASSQPAPRKSDLALPLTLCDLHTFLACSKVFSSVNGSDTRTWCSGL